MIRDRKRRIDGFISGGGQVGGPKRRTDGFHPVRQPTTNLGGPTSPSPEAAERDALLDEPIVLDQLDEGPRKRRFKPHFRPTRLRIVLKRALLTGGIIVLAMVGMLGYKFYVTQRDLLAGGGHAPAICNGDVPLSVLKKEGDGRVNVLLAGIGGEGHDGPYLTDTIMIASLDPFNDRVDLLSIPRDLWVDIPGNGQDKINAAYVYGREKSRSDSEFEKNKDSVELLDKIIEEVIGIDIHYHTVFNFKAFAQAVDALGGVTVNVPETLFDPSIAWENDYNPVIASKGVQEFDGARALLYAKSRKTSSDFDRSERQRLLLLAIKDKSLSLGTFSNPIRAINLMNSLGDNVYSDFDTRSIKCLYDEGKDIQSSSVKSLDLVTPPNDLVASGPYRGRSIVRPKAGLFDYSQIQSYVRSTLRDGLIARENAAIAVYNATSTAGLASKKADELKSYGYRVTVVENAANQTNPATTTMIELDRGKNKYSRHYLENRLDVVAQSKLPSGLGINPPEGTAFVIIVGSDAALAD